jgi:hypothetical protein
MGGKGMDDDDNDEFTGVVHAKRKWINLANPISVHLRKPKGRKIGDDRWCSNLPHQKKRKENQNGLVTEEETSAPRERDSELFLACGGGRGPSIRIRMMLGALHPRVRIWKASIRVKHPTDSRRRISGNYG